MSYKPEVKTKPLAEGIGRIMKKLILSFLLIGFVALSAFDSPKHESEKSKTEVVASDVTIDAAIEIKNVAYPLTEIIQFKDKLYWTGFNSIAASAGMFEMRQVCSTEADSNGLVWCCWVDGIYHGGCEKKCPYC